MADANFDTLTALRNLTSVGFSKRQAEAVTALINTTRQADAGRTATRSDLEALKLTTKADIETAKADIIEWVTGLIGFQTVAVLGASVALAKALH